MYLGLFWAYLPVLPPSRIFGNFHPGAPVLGKKMQRDPSQHRANLIATGLPYIAQRLYGDRLPVRGSVFRGAAPHLESGLPCSCWVQFGM
jgi:hypothetical protein